MNLEHLTTEQRVKFMTALRAVVGANKKKNLAGVPIVSDFDLVASTDFQKKVALNAIYGKIEKHNPS